MKIYYTGNSLNGLLGQKEDFRLIASFFKEPQLCHCERAGNKAQTAIKESDAFVFSPWNDCLSETNYKELVLAMLAKKPLYWISNGTVKRIKNPHIKRQKPGIEGFYASVRPEAALYVPNLKTGNLWEQG